MKKLSGNQLKILAAVFMTADHIGAMLFPRCVALRCIGRLAMPLFAYMLAEGCRYTKNRWRYFGGIAGLALGMQVVYYFAAASLYQCILVSFALAVGIIFTTEYARKANTVVAWLGAALVFALGAFATLWLPALLPETDFHIDYGFWGMLLPVVVYFGKTKGIQLGLCAAVLAFLCVEYGGVQVFAFLALPLLWLYSGARGKWRMKHFFYIYYPAHLLVLWLLDALLKAVR